LRLTRLVSPLSLSLSDDLVKDLHLC
jgi:hypothetical protein